jgi:hypothetical protein
MNKRKTIVKKASPPFALTSADCTPVNPLRQDVLRAFERVWKAIPSTPKTAPKQRWTDAWYQANQSEETKQIAQDFARVAKLLPADTLIQKTAIYYDNSSDQDRLPVSARYDKTRWGLW